MPVLQPHAMRMRKESAHGQPQQKDWLHTLPLPVREKVEREREADRPAQIFGKTVIYFDHGDFHRKDGRVIEGVTFIGVRE